LTKSLTWHQKNLFTNLNKTKPKQIGRETMFNSELGDFLVGAVSLFIAVLLITGVI